MLQNYLTPPQNSLVCRFLKGSIPITGGLSVCIPIFHNPCIGWMKKGNHSRNQPHDLTFFSTEKGVCALFNSAMSQSPSDAKLHY